MAEKEEEQKIETYSIFGTPHEQPRRRVNDISEIEPGDHITYGSMSMFTNTFMGSHAIVERVEYESSTIHIIHFQRSLIYGTIERSVLRFSDFTIYKVLYKPDACRSAEDIVEYARSKVGHEYSILNGGNFVRSCKTGQGREVSEEKNIEEEEEEGAVGGAPPDSSNNHNEGQGHDDVPREKADPSADDVDTSTFHNLHITSSQISQWATATGRASATVAKAGGRLMKKAGSLGVVGAVFEVGSASHDTYKAKQLKDENIMSDRQFQDAVGTRWTIAAGSTAGPLLGAMKGAAVGSVLAGPAAPVGAVVGSLIGGISGLLVGTTAAVGMAKAGIAARNALEEDLDAENRDSPEQGPEVNPKGNQGNEEHKFRGMETVSRALSSLDCAAKNADSGEKQKYDVNEEMTDDNQQNRGQNDKAREKQMSEETGNTERCSVNSDRNKQDYSSNEKGLNKPTESNMENTEINHEQKDEYEKVTEGSKEGENNTNVKESWRNQDRADSEETVRRNKEMSTDHEHTTRNKQQGTEEEKETKNIQEVAEGNDEQHKQNIGNEGLDLDQELLMGNQEILEQEKRHEGITERGSQNSQMSIDEHDKEENQMQGKDQLYVEDIKEYNTLISNEVEKQVLKSNPEKAEDGQEHVRSKQQHEEQECTEREPGVEGAEEGPRSNIGVNGSQELDQEPSSEDLEPGRPVDTKEGKDEKHKDKILVEDSTPLKQSPDISTTSYEGEKTFNTDSEKNHMEIVDCDTSLNSSECGNTGKMKVDVHEDPQPQEAEPRRDESQEWDDQNENNLSRASPRHDEPQEWDDQNENNHSKASLEDKDLSLNNKGKITEAPEEGNQDPAQEDEDDPENATQMLKGVNEMVNGEDKENHTEVNNNYSESADKSTDAEERSDNVIYMNGIEPVVKPLGTVNLSKNSTVTKVSQDDMTTRQSDEANFKKELHSKKDYEEYQKISFFK